MPKQDTANNIDQMFNKICYEYLSNICKKLPISQNDETLTEFHNELEKIFLTDQKYDPKKSYGNYYTAILNLIRKNINSLINNQSYHDFIISLYVNNNYGLEIANETLKTITEGQKQVRDKGLNKVSPKDSESSLSRVNSVIGNYFLPMLTTSIPNVKNFDFKKAENSEPVELRHGTQAEIFDGKARVNPLYEGYIKVKNFLFKKEKSKNTDDSKEENSEKSSEIHTVYFNLLKTEDVKNKNNIERNREGKLTNALYDLEGEEGKRNGIVVITLPADEGFLDESFVYDDSTVKREKAFEEIKNLAVNNGGDFRISEYASKLLFGDNKNKERIISDLLKSSLEHLGLSGKEYITKAERHALMFHFVKFELTNYILEKLNPEHFNISCKDAIDRAAVHSLYYNTIKSCKDYQNDHQENHTKEKISELDFKKHLDSAALEVKGRQINFHKRNLANAFNVHLKNKESDNNFIPEHINKWTKKTTLTGISRILKIVSFGFKAAFKKPISFIKKQFFDFKAKQAAEISKEVYGEALVSANNNREEVKLNSENEFRRDVDGVEESSSPTNSDGINGSFENDGTQSPLQTIGYSPGFGTPVKPETVQNCSASTNKTNGPPRNGM